jgi:hypothetical protein
LGGKDVCLFMFVEDGAQRWPIAACLALLHSQTHSVSFNQANASDSAPTTSVRAVVQIICLFCGHRRSRFLMAGLAKQRGKLVLVHGSVPDMRLSVCHFCSQSTVRMEEMRAEV